MFKLVSKGDQLKIKLTNLKFSKIGDGPKFLLFGGFSNRGKALSICYPFVITIIQAEWCKRCIVQYQHAWTVSCRMETLSGCNPLCQFPSAFLGWGGWVILLGSVWQEACSRKLKQLLHLYVVHLRSNIFFLHNLRWFCCIWYSAVLCGMIRMLPVIIDV